MDGFIQHIPVHQKIHPNPNSADWMWTYLQNNIFSHLTLVVPSYVDSFGFICPGIELWDPCEYIGEMKWLLWWSQYWKIKLKTLTDNISTVGFFHQMLIPKNFILTFEYKQINSFCQIISVFLFPKCL